MMGCFTILLLFFYQFVKQNLDAELCVSNPFPKPQRQINCAKLNTFDTDSMISGSTPSQHKIVYKSSLFSYFHVTSP